MAKYCALIIGISFIYLLRQINTSNCLNTPEKKYKYDVVPFLPIYDDTLIHFSGLIRNKRDVAIEETNSNVSTTASTIMVNKSIEKIQQNMSTGVSSMNVTQPSNDNSRNNNNSKSINTKQLINEDKQKKTNTMMESQQKLGVNGTGQRYDMMNGTIVKPSMVSQPINPLEKTTKLLSQSIAPKEADILPNSGNDTKLVLNIDDIDKMESETNQTLLDHNIIKFEEDYHMYYNSTLVVDEVAAKKYWQSLKNLSVSLLLSKSHRRAMTVQLSFDFPFYGHPVRNVTVATGGFLYTGEYVHSWLAATQYIAPLMANFDTSLSNDSFVKFSDNGTTFTVLWENVTLQERLQDGRFTFSASLHSNGDIVFAYYSVPMRIEAIQDDRHPVKVGLSDAYIIDKTIFFARRKTIYEYHRVNFGNQDIQNGTIIYISAQPTCLSSTDCVSCLTQSSFFKCTWCPTLNRCSTGMDRKRQDWLQKGCVNTYISNQQECPAIGEKGNNAAASTTESPPDDKWRNVNETFTNRDTFLNNNVNNNINNNNQNSPTQPQDLPTNNRMKMDDFENMARSSFGTVLGCIIPIVALLCAVVWILYAYRNPHSKSGQLLIQYRPSQWSWRRGEARYTAATIHM